jgi:hypothetical protein
MADVRSGSAVAHDEAATYLSGRWLVVARVGSGVLAALGFAVFVAGLPVFYLQSQTVRTDCAIAVCAPGQPVPSTVEALARLHISLGAYAMTRLLLSVLVALVYFAVAAVLAWRRSRDWLALLVALLLVMQGAFATTNVLESAQSLWQISAQLVDYLNYVLLVVVFSLFPTGRLVPRWAGGLVAVMALIQLGDFYPAITITWGNQFQLVVIGVLLGLVVAQIYRYRRDANPVRRLQTKWVFYAVALVSVVEVMLSLPYLFLPALTQTGSLYDLFDVMLGFFIPVIIPLAFGIAILRYRLWDIEIIIRRTLIYGSLTAILAGIYAGAVFGAQALTVLLTGRGGQQPVVVVATTLLIWALFEPLRRRIQAFIDQRFYRPKYDAARTLAAFGQTLRAELDLSQLSERLVAVVEETMQPAQVSLWLRPPRREGQPAEQREPMAGVRQVEGEG